MSENLKPGATIVVHWEANPRSPIAGAVKSNRTTAGRTKKIILPAQTRRHLEPKPGETWICRVERISSPRMETKGAIFATPLNRKLDYDFEGVWIEPVKAQMMATVLQDPRRNLMLEGDQGTGKSTIGAAIADTLGWEFRKVSCGAIKKFTYMLGRYVPKADNDTMAFEWSDSKLAASLREANEVKNRTFLIMLDEFSRMDEDARDVLLDIIEGKNRVLRLPKGEEIPVGNNVVFMAAANVGQGFTLRTEDAAAKDRWVIIKITAMPPAEELAHCLKLYPHCPREQLEKTIKVLNAIREARLDPRLRLSKTISTRAAETAAMLLADGFDLDDVLQTAIVNQYPGVAADEASEAGRVNKLISETLDRS